MTEDERTQFGRLAVSVESGWVQSREQWPRRWQFQHLPLNGRNGGRGLRLRSGVSRCCSLSTWAASCSTASVSLSTLLSCLTLVTGHTPNWSSSAEDEIPTPVTYDSISSVAATASSRVAGHFCLTLKATCGCNICWR